MDARRSAGCGRHGRRLPGTRFRRAARRPQTVTGGPRLGLRVPGTVPAGGGGVAARAGDLHGTRADRRSTPAATPPPPPSPSAATGPVTNTHSGLCLDTNGPQRPGLDVVLRTCGNFSGQIWRHDETGLHLTNTPSGLCLDTNGKPATGVPAVLNPCGNHTGQQWRYDAESGRLANPASGLCLDTNGPPANNVALVLDPCGNYTGQGWRM
ncbi:RICIN domain-containing protein [Streptomyces tanashiensis]